MQPLVKHYKSLLSGAISPIMRRKWARKIRFALNQKVLERNLQVRNLFASQSRCFIVGAGPSLKDLDTDKLRNETVIGINQAYLNKGVQSVRKKSWILIDYFLMKQTPVETLTEIERGVGEAIYFLPTEAIEICKHYKVFQRRDKYYFKLGHFAEPYDRITDSHLNLCDAIIRPRGTAETAIICALFMGFKRIYLIGVDSDWFAHRSLEGTHFYRVADNPYSVDNKIKDWIDYNSMESKLQYGYLLYRSYRLLYEALQERNVEVFNASGGGLLDVFPLVDYDSLFD